MGVGESIYTQRNNILSRMRVILERIMTETPVAVKAKDGTVSTCQVARIIVTEEHGIWLQDEVEATASANCVKSAGGSAVQIISGEVFKNDTGLLKLVVEFVRKYPRLRILKKSFEVSRDMTHDETVFLALNETTTFFKGIGGKYGAEVKKFLVEGDTLITLGISDVVYDVVVLYDATDKYVEMVCGKKDAASAKKFKSLYTFQGRFKDDRDVAVLTLSAYGFNRGMIAEGILYTRNYEYDEMNEGMLKYTPVLNIKDHCRAGVTKCADDMTLVITNLGINLENTNVGVPPSKDAVDVGNAAANSMALLKVSNIVDHDFSEIGDIISTIRNRKSGLVMLDDVTADEVLDAFYYPTDKWTSWNTKHGVDIKPETEPLFGGYGNNMEVCQRNPLIKVHILKEFKDKLEHAMVGSGVTSGAYNFYIMTANSTVNGEALYELSKRAVVFYLTSFDSLVQAYAMMHEWDIKEVFDNVIYIGDLTNKGMLVNSWVRRLMNEGDTMTMKKIPLRFGKELDDEDGTYIHYRNYVQNLLMHNKGVKSLIMSDTTRTVTEYGVGKTVNGLKLRNEELLLIMSNLLGVDVDRQLNENLIVRKITDVDVHGKTIPLRFVVTRQTSGIIKVSIEPINTNITTADPTIGKYFDTKGYSLLCGEPSSGKHTTIRSICRNLSNQSRVLVLDPMALISKEYFDPNLNLDLTIYQGENLNAVKALLSTRPDTIIVFKVPVFNKEWLFAVADSCTPEQQLVLATDELFCDFMVKAPERFSIKLFTHMGVVIDQMRIQTKDGVSKIIYKKMGRDEFIGIPMDDASRPGAMGLWIYKNIVIGAPDGLKKQVELLYTKGDIDEKELSRINYSLARNYKMMEILSERG